ncbi:MAG: hypothetical protein OEV28_06090 [Nitrospirota bacterium]|nr:hypothetical protein [Nitrospirota bacterium]
METTAETAAECGTGKGKSDHGVIYKAGLVTGNTAAGVGAGVVTGIGLVLGAAFAEVAVPAFLVLKAFGLTGGAMGFLRGMKKIDR